MQKKQPPRSAASLRAEELVKQFPDTPSRTLAKRLADECSMTVDAARSLVRSHRGTKGVQHRKYKRVDAKKGKAGWKPEMPPSLAEPWTTFDLENCSKIGIISDSHIPYHCEMALAKSVEHLKRMPLDCLLINGDFADCYTISRWQRDPRKRDFRTERKLLRQGLEWLRAEFPKVRMIFKKGNHEERWDHYLWNHAPEIADMEHLMMEHWLDFESLSIEMVEDQRPIMCGKLPVLHGHELPKGLTNPVNMARGAFLRTSHTVLVGHGHRTSGHAESDMFGDELFCWSTGCLCDMNPEYARINRWNYGFAFVEVSGESFNVQNFRITKDGDVRTS